VAAAGTTATVFIKADIRRMLARDASFENVKENLTHPFSRVRRGTELDHNALWVNYVAHPGLFALEGLYLRRRGHSAATAFLFTQVHSVLWEFVIEGCATPPSGKDLVSDATGAALGIWVLRPLASGARRRLAERRGRLYDHVLRYVDPFETLFPSSNARATSVAPHVGRTRLGVQLTIGF
jgi:hypothetical protein